MKNLENEYKKSQTEEMPDLWNRIESGLPRGRKSRILRLMAVYGGAAAALLLLLVSAGLFLQRDLYGGKSDANQVAPQNAEGMLIADTETFIQETAGNNSAGSEDSLSGTPVSEAPAQEAEDNGAGSEDLLSGTSVSEAATQEAAGTPVQSSQAEEDGVPMVPMEEADILQDGGTWEAAAAWDCLAGYLREEGILPEEVKISEYEALKEGETVCSWKAEEEGKVCFLEFSGYSEDGECLLFSIWKQNEDGSGNVLEAEYGVNLRTGAVEKI